jgi:hypothetical protein
MTVTLKTLRSARKFVSEGLLKYFPRFSSSLPEFEAKFLTHTLLFQVLHFHLKKITSWSLHLFTTVTVARLLEEIE